MTYSSENAEVAQISDTGLVSGVADGNTVLSAQSQNIQAVTAVRVGELASPENDAELNVAIAEINGLDPYPDAVSLPEEGKRQLSLTLNGDPASPSLSAGESGTRYFVSNQNVANVSQDGLITALDEGVATVTAIHGAAEAVIPIRVENPQVGPATLGADGGVVQASDGSTVMVAPGALAEDASVSLTPLSQDDLSLPFPDDIFDSAGAFKLDVGDDPLKVPAQLAIPAPAGLEAGTVVFFMRSGALPDATGNWNSTWLIEETGVVGADGTIRTTSPPFNGIGIGGEYTLGFIPSLGFVPPVDISQLALFTANAEAARLTTNLALETTYLAARLGAVGIIAATYAQFAATALLLAYLAKYLQTSIEVIGIPKVGLPVVTTAGVELNPKGIPSFKAVLSGPAPGPADPLAPPVLQEAELKFENGEPVVFLKGSNFLNDFNDKGSKFEDLIGKFYVGDRVYEGSVLPNLSRELGDNQFEIALEVPNILPLGEAKIVLSRQQKERYGSGPDDYEIIELDSEEEIQLAPTCLEQALVARQSGDGISIINLIDPESAIQAASSSDLLTANIPVKTGEEPVGPTELAVTSNSTRAYVLLEQSGRVAIADLVALRQLDTNPETPDVDPINLPSGAKPRAIAIDPRDEYAYVADGGSESIYVLDINPFSQTYNEVIQTISVSSAPSGLRQMAISKDGRRLFITALNGQIFVVNIDPSDRPSDLNENPRKWHEQIGAIAAYSGNGSPGTDGIAPTSDPLKMVFTNRLIDAQGFGVLEITNDDPLNFAATTRHASLGLGLATDYFDVNRATSVAITRDGSYAFVAAINDSTQTGVESVDGVRAGSNIGIIKDPLGPEPKLVAATRPIPKGLTTDLVLSSDDKYLTASYPGLKLESTPADDKGALFTFDVEEIIKTLEKPSDYLLDNKDRGTGSVAFDNNSQRSATAADLNRVPIDDINQNISVAADYEIVGGNWVTQFTFGTPEGTKRAPIAVGGNPLGLTQTSASDWLELGGPIGTIDPASNSPRQPKFTWDFKGKEEGELCGIKDFNTDGIKEVNLYISTFKKGEGLVPGDWSPTNLPEDSATREDYNPNRVLTAKWENSEWKWNGGSTFGSFDEFTLPDDRMLTAGQKYHWAVKAIYEGDTGSITIEKDGEFSTPLPPAGDESKAFSSVTVLTRGFELRESEIDSQFEAMAKHVTEAGGSVMGYDETTGKWNFIEGSQSPVRGKPLLLIPGWKQSFRETASNSGFNEAAADALFASLVQLDQEYEGKVGDDSSGRLYDENGELIRHQGAIFNSPLHFIGFGQGAVVNNEMIQRLGTFLPKAGGLEDSDIRDIQMTTIDPHDFEQPNLQNILTSVNEPEVKVWENVTYADNYYQRVPDLNSSEETRTRAGREIEQADWNVFLGGANASGSLDPSSRAKFAEDDKEGVTHNRALGWYGGTTNLSQSELLSENGDLVYRRLGDLEKYSPDKKTWYTPDHTSANYPLGDENAPWEGIGTGWFHSYLGGGSELRPYEVGGSKRRKEDLGNFEDYLKNNRGSVFEDNTTEARMRGDYAVPTLFNGNFDAIATKFESQNIPGWSFYNGGNDVSQRHLVEWSQIDSLAADYRTGVGYNPGQPNYALKMGGTNGLTEIVHNPFVVPDWGALRFDVHVPVPARLDDAEDYIQVYLETDTATYTLRSQEITPETLPFPDTLPPGEEVNQIRPAVDLREVHWLADNQLTMQSQLNRIGFGSQGFETFQVDVPDEVRGKTAKLRFKLQGDTVAYVDNVFFQSEHLKFGNPALYGQEARADQVYQQNNYLIEKQQYAVSYNDSLKIPNWVSYKLDKSWLVGTDPSRPYFQRDFSLPFEDVVIEEDYKNFGNSGLRYIKGHMVPNQDRVRGTQSYYTIQNPNTSLPESYLIAKDNFQTFLTTNVVGQPQYDKAWQALENELNTFVKNNPREIYVIAGRFGSSDQIPSKPERPDGRISQFNIDVPKDLWKVVLIPEEPGQSPTDITPNAVTFGVLLQNADQTGQNWRNSVLSVNDIEELTDYDFFSNIPEEIQNAIEDNTILPF